MSARDLLAEFSDVFARSQTVAVPLLERDERRAFIEWADAILADRRSFAARPTLIYGDLSPEHTFYDATTQRICGIIDFGDRAIADPDYDLMYADSEMIREGLTGLQQLLRVRCAQLSET